MSPSSPSQRKQRLCPQARERHTSPTTIPTIIASPPNTVPAQDASFLTVPTHHAVPSNNLRTPQMQHHSEKQTRRSRQKPTRSLSAPAPSRLHNAPKKKNNTLRKKLTRSFSTSLLGGLLSRHSHTYTATQPPFQSCAETVSLTPPRPSASSSRRSRERGTYACFISEGTAAGVAADRARFERGRMRERYDGEGRLIEQGPRWSDEVVECQRVGRKVWLMGLQEEDSAFHGGYGRSEERKAGKEEGVSEQVEKEWKRERKQAKGKGISVWDVYVDGVKEVGGSDSADRVNRVLRRGVTIPSYNSARNLRRNSM